MGSDKSITVRQARGIVVAAAFAAAAVLGAFAIYLATGVSAEQFQSIVGADRFNADLLAAADPLRAVLTIDAVFIAGYTVVFALMYTAWRHRAPVVAAIGLALIGLTVVLDLIENQLTLTAIGNVELGQALSSGQITGQVVVSQVKFHAGYLGLVMFGVMLPATTAVERALKAALIYVQLPVGALVFTTDLELFPLARTGFFVVGLAAIAVIAHKRAPRDGADRSTDHSGSARAGEGSGLTARSPA